MAIEVAISAVSYFCVMWSRCSYIIQPYISRVISTTLAGLEVCKIIRYVCNFSVICPSLPFIFRDSVC